jgi:hypothetical protein
MQTLKIVALRPTQITHGLREIRQKTAAYKSLSGHALRMAIAEKPIPIVYGPGGAAFAIDHHHVATALRCADIQTVPFVLVEDLSSLTQSEFWLTLENHRWTYPYDVQGRRVSFTTMPKHIWDLADDEYRSLAASVRDAGGYEKTTVPLAEFRWADLFRNILPCPSSDAEFKSLVKKAVKLAKSAVAMGLPGFIGPEK